MSIEIKREIPRIIHYCWFGHTPKPELAKKCIQSWEKYFPDFEIKEWNEDNFDVTICDYIKEAYTAKKWAFVSDYARCWIMYEFGGIYFDTDVEVIKSFEDILEKGPFMGCEASEINSFKEKRKQTIISDIKLAFNSTENKLMCCKILTDKNISDNNKQNLSVNLGLGIGAYPKQYLYKMMLEFYSTQHFIMENGCNNTITIVEFTSALLDYMGVHDFNNIIQIEFAKNDFTIIYPKEFFCPLDYHTGQLSITEQTHSIHHYSESWLNSAQKIENSIRRYLVRHGYKNQLAERIITLPFRIVNKIQSIGIKGTLILILKKIQIIEK